MTTIPRTGSALRVIDGGKEAPAPKDPTVKLRFDETPDRPNQPLTADEIDDLRILGEPES